MSVTERTTKARAAAMFGKVSERDAQGRVKVVLVPGSEAKLYQVIIRRSENSLTTECNLQTSMGNVPCKGNTKSTVCYHSMAALLLASEEKNVDVSFCDNSDDAKRLTNLGRKVTPVCAYGLGGVIYLSTRKPEVKPLDNLWKNERDEDAAPLNESEARRLAIRNAMYGEA